jgi:hypothetical protein
LRISVTPTASRIRARGGTAVMAVPELSGADPPRPH